MSIMEADLADASVPTNKLRVNANRLWADADLIMPGGGATVHQLSLWLPTDGPHLVELNAYANVTCVCDIGSGSAPVSWVFLVDGQPVSPEYQGTVDAAHPLFIPMSYVTDVAGWGHTFEIVVMNHAPDEFVELRNLRFSVVDRGTGWFQQP